MTVLVTVLGIQANETRYEFDGASADARLAPVALVRLLPRELSPWTVVCVCTAAAGEKTYDTLASDLENMESPPTLVRVDVPDGLTADEVEGTIGVIVHAVVSTDDPDVVVDLTHGPRHLAAVTFMLALYLNALADRRVLHVFYGHLQPSRPSPLIDLGMLLRLVDWTYAVHTFQTTGSLIPMADLLEGAGRSSETTRRVRSVDVAYRAGLPLELGIDIAKLDPKGLRKDLRAGRVPLSGRLGDLVCGSLGDLGLGNPKKAKKEIPLAKTELERQHRLAARLLKQGYHVAALALMNEWITSWFLLQTRADHSSWLHKDVRQQANWKLTTLQKISKDPELAEAMLSEEQRNLGRFLAKLSGVRNGLAHSGMRPQHVVHALTEDLSEIMEFWDRLPDEIDTLDLDPLARVAVGTVLVTPLGRQHGVLFSALRLCEPAPDCCIAICSEETHGTLGEAAERAGFRGELVTVVMRDPHGGTGEIEEFAVREQRRILAAERVRVNVTGGTTVMGIAAERFARLARDYARPTRRFALLDRRSQEEQSTDPFVEGEILWLDEEE